jgi:hypothetical protein
MGATRLDLTLSSLFLKFLAIILFHTQIPHLLASHTSIVLQRFDVKTTILTACLLHRWRVSSVLLSHTFLLHRHARGFSWYITTCTQAFIHNSDQRLARKSPSFFYISCFLMPRMHNHLLSRRRQASSYSFQHLRPLVDTSMSAKTSSTDF